MLFPFTFFFAEQSCNDCHKSFPLAVLAPIRSETGTWAGFRCGCA